MLLTLAAFALALGILIVVHEMGHYLVARACGVKVLRFSVGFGRVLVKRIDRRGTEWALSLIPLGGYVKMLDEREGEVSSAERHRAFNTQAVGKRIAIVAAGPIFNLVLAALLYASINLAGVDEPAPVVGAPAAESIAARGGLQAGDRITAVDGQPVTAWSEVRWLLLDQVTNHGAARLAVKTAAGAQAERRLDFAAVNLDDMEGDVLGRNGLKLVDPKPVVRGLIDGGAAQAAGLKAGDRIVAAGDVAAPGATQFIDIVKAHADKPLQVQVLRDGATLTIPVRPQAVTDAATGQSAGRIGAQIGGDLEMVTLRYGPIDSLVKGVQRTGEVSWFSLRMLGKMLTGDVSWRNLSGPVTIADYAGQTARLGLSYYIAFMALVSVSLGVLNLLPIPVLDGGHLLYYFVEIVRGSPPPERWADIGQRAGFGILVALMAVALFNDVARLLT
jgi:regulator of sigma E protease